MSLLAPDVHLGGSPRVYADARERERLAKQRQRDRRRARGLTGDNRALVDPAMQRVQLARHRCPAGCVCRDCLFPATEYRPHVVRFVGAYA